MSRKTIKGLVEEHKITAEVTFGAPEREDFKDGTGWTVKLTRRGKDGRRTLTVPFYMGPAHTREPDASEVLSCLVSDATSFDNARSFEEWASDFGYDPDSRKAEATYREVEAQTARVIRFLGDTWDAFRNAEGD